MNKAFIFDMDGVLIDTENHWVKEERFLEDVLGKDIYDSFETFTGFSIKSIFEKARTLGSGVTEKKYYGEYNKRAQRIYREAKLTDHLDELFQKLKKGHYKIGIVTSSPLAWVEIFLGRLKGKNPFDTIISLHERDDIKHKPHPDGYLEAIEKLGSKPENTIILEDSNNGIKSAKTAGAFVIGFTSHLTPNYKQTGADVYANSVEDILRILDEKKH